MGSSESNEAKYNFCVEMDWIELQVSINSSLGDNWKHNINPDMIYVAKKFLKQCEIENLKIKWSFRYSEKGKEIEKLLNDKLGVQNDE